MNRVGNIKSMLLVAMTFMQPMAVNAIELTRDEPATLIGTQVTDYKFYDMKLGLTHREVWAILKENPNVIGVIDGANPSGMYIYKVNTDGSRGNAVMHLAWAPREQGIGTITLLQSGSESVTGNFARLLTSEVLDESSNFRNTFLGKPDRFQVLINVPSRNLQHTAYYYDTIGLKVMHKRSPMGEEIELSLAKPNSM